MLHHCHPKATTSVTKCCSGREGCEPEPRQGDTSPGAVCEGLLASGSIFTACALMLPKFRQWGGSSSSAGKNRLGLAQPV